MALLTHVAAIFCVLFLLCTVSNADMSPDDGVKPVWADEYSVGTRCSCEALSGDGFIYRSMLCYNYRLNFSLAQVEVEFNCTCFDRTHLCSLLPFSQTWAGELTDCVTYDMNDTVPFTDDQPTCVDDAGVTCGELPGRANQTQLTYIPPVQNGSYVYYYCRSDTVKFNCTTGICAVNPVPCIVQYDEVPWSPCQVTGGVCTKLRTFPILQEAANGAPACPSFAERTELAECSPTECAQQSCSFSTVRVEGNCSTACGPGVRNVTFYNVSANNLEECIASGFDPIINQTEVNCTYNLPCDADGLPIALSCISQGNTGARGQQAAQVRINFNTSLVLAASPFDIINSFIVTESVYGRRMPVDLTSPTIGPDNLNLTLLYDVRDYEPTTGFIFIVTFKQIEGLNITIRGNNQPVPSFQLRCTDGSPPALIYMSWYNNSEESWEFQAPLYFVFSEPIRSLIDDGATFIIDQFLYYGMEKALVGSLGALAVVFGDDGEYSSYYSMQGMIITGPYTNISVQDIPGNYKDMSGNSNFYSPDAWVTVSQYLPPFYMFIVPGGSSTDKLISSTNNGTIDRVLITSQFPLTLDNLQNNLKYSVAIFDVFGDSLDTYDVTSSIRVNPLLITYAPYGEEYASSFMLHIPPVDTLGKRYLPASLDSVYLGKITAFVATGVELLTQNVYLPGLYERWTPSVGSLAAVTTTAFAAPVVLFAQTSINSTTLNVTMSRWAPSEAAFSLSTFNYNGSNSIANITRVINNTYVIMEMALPYTFDMILTDKISFNGTYTGGEVDLYLSEASWRYRNVTLINGTRPSVLVFSLKYDNTTDDESESESVSVTHFETSSWWNKLTSLSWFQSDQTYVAVSSQSIFHTMAVTTTPPTVPNTLVVTFDVAVDPTTVSTSSFLITPANPLISSVTVTSVTMSANNKVATLKVSTACQGSVCFDTGPQLVSLTITSITDINGHRITEFISSTAFDLMPPSLMSVTCITSKTCQLVFTEPVKDLLLSQISPSPVACYETQSAILYYAEQQTVGTEFYFDSTSDIRDLSGNVVATGKATAVKMGSNVPKKKCSGPSDLSEAAQGAFWALVALDAVLLLVLIGLLIARACILHNSSNSAKSMTNRMNPSTEETQPLVKPQPPAQSSFTSGSSVPPKAPPPPATTPNAPPASTTASGSNAVKSGRTMRPRF